MLCWHPASLLLLCQVPATPHCQCYRYGCKHWLACLRIWVCTAPHLWCLAYCNWLAEHYDTNSHPRLIWISSASGCSHIAMNKSNDLFAIQTLFQLNEHESHAMAPDANLASWQCCTSTAALLCAACCAHLLRGALLVVICCC